MRFNLSALAICTTGAIPPIQISTRQDATDPFQIHMPSQGVHVGWMEGSDGVGTLHFHVQNSVRIAPMIAQPTTAFTLSINHSAKGRIEKA
jgi:hypothetical protein